MLRSLSVRMKRIAERAFPERRIILRSENATRYLRLSPLGQALSCAALALSLGWTGYITFSHARAALMASGADASGEIYEARIEAMNAATLRLADELSSARGDAEAAERILTETHKALIEARGASQSRAEKLAAQSGRLSRLEADYAAAVEIGEATARRVADLETSLVNSRRKNLALSDTLLALNGALGDVAEQRDAASQTTETLAIKIDELSAEITDAATRRSRIFTQLEDAAELSLGSLEGVFEKSGVEIDPILNQVRRENGGSGGPFVPADDEGALATGTDAEPDARLIALMGKLERVNLMRIATERMPFATPTRGARLSSGFGFRRDPKNGRRARHTGMDFAGDRGAPIRATAKGVVTFAGRRRGYGNVIEIRHAFGYETLYAHLSRIRVKAGAAIERGDRIGDMGATGRSTGVHLHYEVRIGGTPVNPRKYIEAARNVL